MKLKLILSVCLVLSFLLSAQETTVNLTLNPGYVNQVYYKLDTEETSSYAKSSWDIAFLRVSQFDLGIRVNDGDGIEVFEASTNPADWDNINLSNESSWTKLYNSETERKLGAFSNGSASYGWGEYNSTTHIVEGKVIFVLKYIDGTYKKFFCEKYANAYTFKYSSWDGSAWSSDETVTLENSSNTEHNYNYYSLRSNEAVVPAPPASDWDFVFTKYFGDVVDNSGNTVKYSLTGVMQNDNITVAEGTGNDTTGLVYSEHINTIGYDWKSFDFTNGWVVNSDKKYYLKYGDNTIYKMYFTAWGGSSNGNVTFKVENVTQALDIEDLNDNITFGVYPNPVKSDRIVNVIYDVNKTNFSDNRVEIFNMTGQKVFQNEVTNAQGFYNNKIDLNNLTAGVYLLKFTSGDYQKTRKIILN